MQMRGFFILLLLVTLSGVLLGQPPSDLPSVATLCEIIKGSGPLKVHFDPAKTRISFGWDGLFDTISFVFQLQSGYVMLDLSVGTASGEIVVDARSGKGGNIFRNRHLHERILESSKYPDVRFHPMTVLRIVTLDRCACRFDVNGKLNLRGKEEPFRFRIDVGAVGSALDLTATSGILNWSNFGVADYGRLCTAVEDSIVYVRAGVRADGLQMPRGCNNPTGIAGERKPRD